MIPPRSRCYLDANDFIYFAEAHPRFGPPVRHLFERWVDGELTLITSELTIAETLVLPFKLGRQELIDQYEHLLRPQAGFEVLPVDASILRESARLRAALRCRLPDAIHVATALAAKCDVFVTEDRSIAPPAGLAAAHVSFLPMSSSDT